MDEIRKMMEEGAQVHKQMTQAFPEKIGKICDEITELCKARKTILLAGNGGSCAEAMHIAAEFTGRFKLDRGAYPAISLSTDMSAVTSISNDYGYHDVFRRKVEAFGQEGSMLFVLSTSGNSPNLIHAVEQAKKMNMRTVSLLGKDGGKLKGLCDYEFIVPSDNGPRIQEAHLTILHAMCEVVEKRLAQ